MRVVFSLATALAFTIPCHAQPVSGGDDDTVVVYGRAIDLIGEAASASEGIVGYADFQDRPLSRAGELVEVIPGAIATQHSGEGKANQYFLRGFNLDHGTDFSASIDGVPINNRTHGHGQGYLDLNFVIPEIVEQVRYRKGPYHADAGDFSAAGSAAFSTYDRLPENFAELRVGQFGYVRGVAAASFDLGADTSLLLAGEGETYDGPWVLAQDLEKFSGVAKLTHAAGNARYALDLWAYNNRWTSTDQIPARAVDSGLIDRFGFIDPDLGGETSRYAISGTAEFDHGDRSTTSLSAYALAYELSLFSDFTYFLDDPLNGDEFEQRDKRNVFGSAIEHVRSLSDVLGLRVGGDVRYDDIPDIGLFRTAARQRPSTVRQDAVTEQSAAVWVEAEIKLTPAIRAIVGLRGDYYDADVDALSFPQNGGSASDTLLSPSLALAWKVNDGVELYANYGQGFHSNDVRGATITIDPASGDPADQVPILVRAEGAEFGARLQQGAWNASLSAFWLTLDSELVFVGDAGTTEANDASERAGIEATAFWQPFDWLALDGSAAWTDARFDIVGPDDRIPNAVETVISGGAVFRFDPLTLSVRGRYFGAAPLIESGEIESSPTTIVNLAGTYDLGRVTLGIELLNLLDADDADITYFFASRFANEASPVEDIHFHPVEPRQLRASLRYRF
ncbi:MAG: TonB-dependent receptor [Burkholderiales bacterium]|nr:MAG: TonB-dependent receptor [Burkholderiales bacterium]